MYYLWCFSLDKLMTIDPLCIYGLTAQYFVRVSERAVSRQNEAQSRAPKSGSPFLLLQRQP